MPSGAGGGLKIEVPIRTEFNSGFAQIPRKQGIGVRIIDTLGIAALPRYEAAIGGQCDRGTRARLRADLRNIRGPLTAKLIAEYAANKPDAEQVRAYFTTYLELLDGVLRDPDLVYHADALRTLCACRRDPGYSATLFGDKGDELALHEPEVLHVLAGELRLHARVGLDCGAHGRLVLGRRDSDLGAHLAVDLTARTPAPAPARGRASCPCARSQAPRPKARQRPMAPPSRPALSQVDSPPGGVPSGPPTLLCGVWLEYAKGRAREGCRA